MFYFTQWGDYNEQGERKKAKQDGLTPTASHGKLRNDCPADLSALMLPKMPGCFQLACVAVCRVVQSSSAMVHEEQKARS
jgi:hypothetical protein